jgi:hypothetical protein
MKKFQRNLRILAPALLLSAFGATAAMAQDAPAPLSTPPFAGPLAPNPAPFYIDTTDWLGDAGGKIYISGQVTGLAYYQSNEVQNGVGSASSLLDLDNAQIEIQKTDGWLQFYVQAGTYSFPTLGVPYLKSSFNTAFSFGNVPVAYLKLQGEGDFADFSIQAGKMNTLIGDEYNFTFQNMNIERGLVWNTEQAFDRGVQVNYANGPLSVSLSWNDGLYTNNLNWMTGLISYALAPTDTIAVAGGGNMGGHNGSNLNQGSMWNLIYTHTDGPLVISPYVQLIETPTTSIFAKSTEVWSGAILASYSFDDNWKIGARAEYESESGKPATHQYDVLGYGVGSSAWSLTVTPTYQWKAFFGRLDLSYVGLTDRTPGLGFANTGNGTDQFRVMFETGVVF